MTPGQRLHAATAKVFTPNGWVDAFPSWDDYDEAGRAKYEAMALEVLEPALEALRPFETAYTERRMITVPDLKRAAETYWSLVAGGIVSVAEDDA